MNYNQKKVSEIITCYSIDEVNNFLKEGWDMYGPPQNNGLKGSLHYTLVKYELGIFISGREYNRLMEIAFRLSQLDK